MSVGIAQPPIPANGDDPTRQDWPEALDPFNVTLTGNALRVHEALKAAVEQLQYTVLVDGYTASDAYVSSSHPGCINIRKEVCRAYRIIGAIRLKSKPLARRDSSKKLSETDNER